MELTEKAEEILESLWHELIEHKKKACELRLLKDKDALKLLIKEGYVTVKDDKVAFTPKGKTEGRGCVRRHRLAERLMADVFELKKQQVHERGCKFEHLLHKGLDDNICSLLGHPKFCPHGTPIPAGPCCRKKKGAPKIAVTSLDSLKKNQKAKVAYLHTHDKKLLDKLMAMGVLPGMDVTVTQRFPSFVFSIGKSQFAVDKELASAIYVRVVG
ncbi:MAG: metal-dependent transcriptional regulator [Candidatus Omnitrophota bacterium]